MLAALKHTNHFKATNIPGKNKCYLWPFVSFFFTGCTSNCPMVKCKFSNSSKSSSYNRMLEIYVQFCNEYFPGVNLFPSIQTMVEHFISHLFVQNYPPSTITSYVSAISYFHKIKNMLDPTASFRIKNKLKGTQNLRMSVDTRMSITRYILFDLVKALPVVIRSVYDHLLLKAMVTMAYFNLFAHWGNGYQKCSRN